MPLVKSELTAAQKATLTAAQKSVLIAYPAATIGFFDVLMLPNAFLLVPDQPGLEFTAPVNRMHFAAIENRMHGTLPINRMQFDIPEED